MILDFTTFSINENIEHKKLIFYHGVKNSENVNKILKDGFDLNAVKPLWTNDYAISVLTDPNSIRKFFGNKDIPILKLEFEGNIIDFGKLGVSAKTPQDYTRQVIGQGIDAVRLEGDRKQAFIYNTKAIKKITLL